MQCDSHQKSENFLRRSYPRIRGDGCVHCAHSRGFRHVAGQHLPHARATGTLIDAGDPDHVLGGRQHVPAFPDAGSNAKGRTADDQRLGD